MSFGEKIMKQASFNIYFSEKLKLHYILTMALKGFRNATMYTLFPRICHLPYTQKMLLKKRNSEQFQIQECKISLANKKGNGLDEDSEL